MLVRRRWIPGGESRRLQCPENQPVFIEASLEKPSLVSKPGDCVRGQYRIRAAQPDGFGERGQAPLPEERRIDVGPMDIGVAADAWCQLGRSCAHPVNCAGGDRAMALIAQRVDIRHVQQPRILRAMGCVAPQTPLRLDRGMLVNERPTRLCVTFGADRILIGRGFQVVVPEGAVRIVAVRASHEAFIHLVVEGHVEGRLDVRVALEAKRRLFGLEQDSLGSSLMHGVAGDAA